MPKKSDERPIEQAEAEGLAERLLALREQVETESLATRKATGELKQELARMSTRLDHALNRVDTMATEWNRRSRALEGTLQSGGEQVRAAGEIARKMSDRVKVLDELRQSAQDPHALVVPLRREVAELKADLESFKRIAENKIAELRPRVTRAPNETREPNEGLERQLVRIHKRVEALERGEASERA